MATVRGSFSTAGYSIRCRETSPSSAFSTNEIKLNRSPNPTRRFAVSTEQQVASSSTTKSSVVNRSFKRRRLDEAKAEDAKQENPYALALLDDEMEVESGNKKSLKDYFEETKDFIRSDGGPPRWFSPLECGSRLDNFPLLLFLPGIDGVGLGLIKHHKTLGKIFDIWCLHIPAKDRTPFLGLVRLVERTVRSENYHSPNRPIYLVGESLGASLALAVAARNPDLDLLLLLANPATSYEKSQLQTLLSLLEVIPNQQQIILPYVLSLMTGDPLRRAMDSAVKRVPLEQRVQGLAQDVAALSSYLNVLADILPRETLLWKLQVLKSASRFVNSRLHAIKAQTLILTSGADQLLPSEEEGQRLFRAIPQCDTRKFKESGHFLLMEDGVDLSTIIKETSFYRHRKYHDFVSDYFPPTPSEFKKVYETNRLSLLATSAVMLSTLEDGKVVKGLAGVPSQGPVLFVGNHMLLGIDLVPIALRFLLERNILLRGLAHPIVFVRLKKEGLLPPLSDFDVYRQMGAVPVSGTNFFKLLSSKAHVLLYPGGMREASHRKGEQHKLFWPERSEFVRMAARFGAKIVPFGTVGEDDFAEVFFDYDDEMKIPVIRNFLEEANKDIVKARITDIDGEVGNQVMHPVGIYPKLPGRFYYFFGKPIETEGRKQELRDKDKAHEVYLQVKSEVENCIAFLKEKREHDPYRNIMARLAYQVTHGFDCEVPTFEL